MDIVKLIILTAKELGPWDFTQVVELLRANGVDPQNLSRILKDLKPYIFS